MKIIDRFVFLLFILVLFSTCVSCFNNNTEDMISADNGQFSMSIIKDVGYENYDLGSGLINDSELLLIEKPFHGEREFKSCIHCKESTQNVLFIIPDHEHVIDSAIIRESEHSYFAFLCFNDSQHNAEYSLCLYDNSSTDPISSFPLSYYGMNIENDVPKICSDPMGSIVIYTSNYIWLVDNKRQKSLASKNIERIQNVSCCGESIIVTTYSDDNYDSIICLDNQFDEINRINLSKNVLGNAYNIISVDNDDITIWGETGIYTFNCKSKDYYSRLIFDQYAMADPICVSVSDSGDILLCVNFLISDDCDMGGYKWICMTPLINAKERETIDICVFYDNGYDNEAICRLFGSLYNYDVNVTYVCNEDDIEDIVVNGRTDEYNSLMAEVIRNKADLFYIPRGNSIDADFFPDSMNVPIYSYDCCVCKTNEAEIFTYRNLDPISYNNLSNSYLPFAYLNDKGSIMDLLYYNKYPEELTSDFQYISNLSVDKYLYCKLNEYEFYGLPGKSENILHKESLGTFYSLEPMDSNNKISDFQTFLNSEVFSSFFNINTVGFYTEYYEINKTIVEFNLKMIDAGFINKNMFADGIEEQNRDKYEQDFLNLLSISEMYQFSDRAISILFNEESQEYIAGVRDLDDAADMFCQRAKRYLSEKG